MRQLRLESLEARRMMIADADTVIDLWPGPMHSDAIFIRTLDDGRAVFQAAVAEGAPYFVTDGTVEGTLQFNYEDLPPVDPVETPIPIEQGITIVDHNTGILIASYEEPGGFSYTFESQPFAYDANLPYNSPVLENYGMVGDRMLTHVTGVHSAWYLASGDHSTWTELQDAYLVGMTEEKANISPVHIVGDSIYVAVSMFDGVEFFSSTGDVHVLGPLSHAYVATPDAVYVSSTTEAGQITASGYSPIFSASDFEFPTTINGATLFDGSPVFGINDPVYGSRIVAVDGTVIERPPILGFEHAFGPYMTYHGGLTDGYQVLDVGDVLENGWIRIPGQSPKMAFTEFVDFDRGRELVVREIRAGDANLDGFFDSADLVALMALGEYEDDLVGNSHHLTGDFNGDGEFNSSDLVEALALGWYRS